MCLSYGTKTCKIPVSLLTCVLHYPAVSKTVVDLKKISVELVNDETNKEQIFARFDKAVSAVSRAQVIFLKLLFNGLIFFCFMQCT